MIYCVGPRMDPSNSPSTQSIKGTKIHDTICPHMVYKYKLHHVVSQASSKHAERLCIPERTSTPAAQPKLWKASSVL